MYINGCRTILDKQYPQTKIVHWNSENDFKLELYHNLEQGETKAGQPEDWLVKKNIVYVHAIKKVLK